MKVKIVRKDKGINATGEFNFETKQLVVKKGSTVSNTISQSPTFRGSNAIVEYRDKYVKNGIVTEDVFFKSSSTAANFVTGSSSNGLTVWKTVEGITLKELSKTLMNKTITF